MAIGTLSPSPWFSGFDNNGDPVSGGKLFVYLAGTTTKVTTWSDVGLTVPNSNPIILDSAGRATIFLSPGVSYKFVLSPSTDTDPPTAPIRTQDNIGSIPPSNVDLDVTGTVGEAVAAGTTSGVYLSDGSGGLVAGRWYKWDADLAYASTGAGVVGMVPIDIASGASGSIRILGRVTGFSGLTAGASYYISSTAGGLTTSPNSRFVGVADSTTSLVLASNPLRPATVDVSICEGRFTPTTAVPVTTADVSGATSIYFTPYIGNRIALYDGVNWNLRTFTEVTISLVGLTASKPYDIFVYDNAGVVTIETLAWTGTGTTATRATALVLQDGILSKTGALTRRWLGSVFINASGGQTDETLAKRYIFNYYNRVVRPLSRVEATSTWTYTTATYRQANAAAANQVEVMNGWAEEPVSLTLGAMCHNALSSNAVLVGLGEDSTTTPVTPQLILSTNCSSTTNIATPGSFLQRIPAVGYHYYAWLEYSGVGNTTTWVGNNGNGAQYQSGIHGTWKA